MEKGEICRKEQRGRTLTVVLKVKYRQYVIRIKKQPAERWKHKIEIIESGGGVPNYLSFLLDSIIFSAVCINVQQRNNALV